MTATAASIDRWLDPYYQPDWGLEPNWLLSTPLEPRAVVAAQRDLPAHARPPDDTAQLLDQDLPRWETRIAHYLKLAMTTRRWDPGRPDPHPYQPRDVPGIMATATSRAVLGVVEALSASLATARNLDLRARLRRDAWQLKALTESVPFFVDPTTTHALAEAEPPGPDYMAEMKLPFPAIVILFGFDLAINADLFTPAETIIEAMAPNANLRQGLTHGANLSGIIIYANTDHTLCDTGGLLLTTNPNPNLAPPFNLDKQRSVIISRWDTAAHHTLRRIVHSFAAITASNQWTTIQPPPLDTTAKTWRKTARKSATRRAIERSGGIKLNIVDITRHTKQRQPQARSSQPTRQPPATHPRRGHFRATPIGPRSTPEHQRQRRQVFIPPTIVHGRPADPQTIRLYQVR